MISLIIKNMKKYYFFFAFSFLVLGCRNKNPSISSVSQGGNPVCTLFADSFYFNGLSMHSLRFKDLKIDSMPFPNEFDDDTIACIDGINFHIIDGKVESFGVPDFKKLNITLKYANRVFDKNTTLDSFSRWFPNCISKEENKSELMVVFNDTIKGVPLIETDSKWHFTFKNKRLSDLEYWMPM